MSTPYNYLLILNRSLLLFSPFASYSLSRPPIHQILNSHFQSSWKIAQALLLDRPPQSVCIALFYTFSSISPTQLYKRMKLLTARSILKESACIKTARNIVVLSSYKPLSNSSSSSSNNTSYVGTVTAARGTDQRFGHIDRPESAAPVGVSTRACRSPQSACTPLPQHNCNRVVTPRRFAKLHRGAAPYPRYASFTIRYAPVM